jgi:hypothetical protein
VDGICLACLRFTSRDGLKSPGTKPLKVRIVVHRVVSFVSCPCREPFHGQGAHPGVSRARPSSGCDCPVPEYHLRSHPPLCSLHVLVKNEPNSFFGGKWLRKSSFIATDGYPSSTSLFDACDLRTTTEHIRSNLVSLHAASQYVQWYRDPPVHTC